MLLVWGCAPSGQHPGAYTGVAVHSPSRLQPLPPLPCHALPNLLKALSAIRLSVSLHVYIVVEA